MKKKQRIIDLENRVDSLESQLNLLETYQDFDRHTKPLYKAVDSDTVEYCPHKTKVKWDKWTENTDPKINYMAKLSEESEEVIKKAEEKDKLLRELGELVVNSYDHWYYADKKYHIALNTGNSNYVALIDKIKALENDK